jgi:uncharacterized UPF0146 family protein
MFRTYDILENSPNNAECNADHTYPQTEVYGVAAAIYSLCPQFDLGRGCLLYRLSDDKGEDKRSGKVD